MASTSVPPATAPATVGGPASEPAFYPPLPGRPRPRRALEILRDGGPEELIRLLDAAGGYFIDDDPAAGTCTITVARRASGPEEHAALMIDALTHIHRRDLSPFLLQRVTADGHDIHVGAFELPRGLLSTIGILVGEPWDPDIGHDRLRWAAAMDDLAPLRRGGPVPAILELPGAVDRPWRAAGRTIAHGPAARPAPPRLFHSRCLGVEVEYRVDMPDSNPEVLLLLCDGHRFASDYPLLPELRAAEAAGAVAPTAVVAFNALDIAGRMAMLGSNPDFPDFLRDELLPRAEAAAREEATGSGGRYGDDPAAPVLPRSAGERVIAGASLGGLTAARTVRVAPDIVTGAIVQSASFWWPADDPDVPGGAELREWADHDPHPDVRIFHEFGTMEGHLFDSNRLFADIARARGADVVAREYVGGHDYACWRAGVIDGLASLHPPRPARGEF